jgi:DNA-binding Lrp family transcriptional regulator
MTTQHLADHSPEARTLRALFELGRLDCSATASALAAALGLRATEVARALIALEQRGLVRADHVRLTLLGLGVATRLSALALKAPAVREKPRLPVVVRGLANARPARAGARRSAQLPRAACH